MKAPTYDIGNKVYVVLLPGGWSGCGPGLNENIPYIFEGHVGGFRWEKDLNDWLAEIYNAVGTFWVREKYLCTDLEQAVKKVENSLMIF